LKTVKARYISVSEKYRR